MEREDVQLYKDIGIDVSKHDVLALTAKEIASSYRKAALKWHPDKNPNDPTAAAKFSNIFLAYETLSDPSKRKVYDEKIRQVRHRRKAFQQLDETRRLMRLQLQQRELQAAHPSPTPQARRRNSPADQDSTARSRIQKEIERLRAQALREHAQAKGNISTQPLHPKTPHSSSSTGTTDADNALHTGPWANVPGYAAFHSKSTSLSLQQLEDAILNGRSPFDNIKPK